MASKRVILTLEQRVNVIKKLDAGRSCRAVAQETGCGKTQITRIKQDRHEIMRLAVWRPRHHQDQAPNDTVRGAQLPRVGMVLHCAFKGIACQR